MSETELAPVPHEAASRRVVLAALAGNLGIAITKFVAFGFTRSTAMLTEAIHSLVDTGNQLLLLHGQRRAARPANDRHPFGYGMETYFWSFIVALMLFLAGGAVAIWEGAEKILHPTPVALPMVSFVVLAVSMVFEGLSFRTAYREYRVRVRGRKTRLLGFLQASKDPNIFATLLEDSAALTGLALAMLGVLGSTLGLAWADGAASIAIGLLLVGVALFMANETRSLIAGEGMGPHTEAKLRAALDGCAELGALTELKTLHLGPHTILVSIGWQFVPTMERAALTQALARLEACAREADARVSHVVFRPQL